MGGGRKRERGGENMGYHQARLRKPAGIRGSIEGLGGALVWAAPGVRSRLPGVPPCPPLLCSFTTCLCWEDPQPLGMKDAELRLEIPLGNPTLGVLTPFIPRDVRGLSRHMRMETSAQRSPRATQKGKVESVGS